MYASKMTVFLAMFLSVVLVFTTTIVQAEEPMALEMVTDLAIVRPLGFLTTAIGLVAFIIALPFTAASGSIGVAGKKLVAEPAQYTFTRPLGKM